jgi:hypothetical protein
VGRRATVREQRDHEVQGARLLQRGALAELPRGHHGAAHGVGVVLVERTRGLEQRFGVEASLVEQTRGGPWTGGHGREQVDAGEALFARPCELLRELAQGDELGLRAGSVHLASWLHGEGTESGFAWAAEAGQLHGRRFTRLAGRVRLLARRWIRTTKKPKARTAPVLR